MFGAKLPDDGEPDSALVAGFNQVEGNLRFAFVATIGDGGNHGGEGDFGKDICCEIDVVRLSGEERQELEALIRKGKGPARRLLKARILLKADVSEAGEGWSDSRIISRYQSAHGLPGAQATGGRGRGGRC